MCANVCVAVCRRSCSLPSWLRAFSGQRKMTTSITEYSMYSRHSKITRKILWVLGHLIIPWDLCMILRRRMILYHRSWSCERFMIFIHSSLVHSYHHSNWTKLCNVFLLWLFFIVQYIILNNNWVCCGRGSRSTQVNLTT